ncbi:MAG: tetratricopeptide repeat protein [Promethearchaeota archaeon]|jgi:tetratricopeptide (TPR) repeat protein
MSDLLNDKLESANQLLIEGFYFKALDAVEEIEQFRDVSLENQVGCSLLKSNIYMELGEQSNALKFAENACNISQELENKSLLLDSYISKSMVLIGKREYDLILELNSKSEELLNELKIKPPSEFAKREALLKLIKSQVYLYKSRNIEKSLQFGEQGLKISEEHGNKMEIALSLQFNSVCYFIVGNLDRALDYLDRCLRVQKTYRKRVDWKTFKDLGVLHGMRGELDLALEYTKQSLASAEEVSNNNFIAQCLNNLSLIYRQKGNLNRAMEALERSLSIWEESGDKMKILGCMDSLFIIALDVNSIEQAQKYLLRMQQINEQVKNKMSDLACRVNISLMLKNSSDSLDQEKAKKLLQQIVKEEIINWEFTERALLHLCDIFILEYQIHHNQEAFSELNVLITRLLDFAEFQSSFRLLAETYLLQGKLALIQMNLGDARQLFTKAERIADEHGLQILARTISTEHDKLLEQLEQWQDFSKDKTPISERFKYVEIDKTLNHMMGKQMIEPPELVEEDPILLLIMNEAGNTCFNHTFIEDWDFRHLFSSFISAFNTFSSEIFSKTIDRIKIGENIIFLQPIETFLTCYVSRGQSYPAMKKLNKFSDSINENKKILEVLNRAAKASRELHIEDLPILGSMIKEIFAYK